MPRMLRESLPTSESDAGGILTLDTVSLRQKNATGGGAIGNEGNAASGALFIVEFEYCSCTIVGSG